MSDKKIIHYCWFGKNPLSNMAKKCIKSWKQYLPDYEIIEWNESNFDINICPFVKEAYEQKKWAFVSDYARMYGLYNHGGIYFDTDMEVLKNIDHLLDDEVFLGYEENKKIAAGVIGVKEKENKYIKEILDYYNQLDGFDEDFVYDYAIPNILTKNFNKYPKTEKDGIDIFNEDIYVYPEEYFYPINYLYTKQKYTKNTCMVHYYSASWVPKGEQLASGVYRKFGQKNGKRILTIYYGLTNFKNRCINSVKDKIWKVRKAYSKRFRIPKRINKINEQIEKGKYNYVVISHPNWIGVGNVAKDNFESNIQIPEVETQKEGIEIAKLLNNHNFKTVVFNGFANGWEHIAKGLKEINPEIKVKVIWHGSHALLSEYYDLVAFKLIHELYNSNVIDELGFVKKSLYDFYKAKGYNVSFLMNNFTVEDKVKEKGNKGKENKDHIRIGLYASGDRWVKNFYNQLSACSLIDNCLVDCIPYNYETKWFADNFKMNMTGKSSNIPRDELHKRMAKNDVNLYVTFTECAPLLPLESLELGVPCITGNNHHYFDGSKLEQYLTVNKADNIMEIQAKILEVLEHKEEIMQLYEQWKKEYNKVTKKSFEDFVK